jgi:NADPH-dependent curcumin reductase CurA
MNNLDSSMFYEIENAIIKKFNKDALLEICGHLAKDGADNADLVEAFRELNALINGDYRLVIDGVISALNTSDVAKSADA